MEGTAPARLYGFLGRPGARGSSARGAQVRSPPLAATLRGVTVRRYSRHTFAYAVRDDEGDLVLYGTEPYRFRDFADTREHRVREGETVYHLAARYFGSFPRPAGLWWVIADFQPDPIHDPTVELEPGRVLYIPSERTLVEEVFSERRRVLEGLT